MHWARERYPELLPLPAPHSERAAAQGHATVLLQVQASTPPALQPHAQAIALSTVHHHLLL